MKSLKTSIKIKRTTLFLIPLMLGFFALSRAAQAVTPPPDGGYPNLNTAEGDNALANLNIDLGAANTALGNSALFSTTSGSLNTATGFSALLDNVTGNYNTANGAHALENNTASNNTATGGQALFNNRAGTNNTANGYSALFSNRNGSNNTAEGASALFNNTGHDNTADGSQALFTNTSGISNTAVGSNALERNNTGSENTALGLDALFSNSSGADNTATGTSSLERNTIGGQNTATGDGALFNNTTGSGNIAVGFGAGSNLTTGSNNIEIGNLGLAAESSTIRIGTAGTQTATFVAGIRGITTGNADAINVVIDSAGQLGTVSSSRRYKKDIKAMDQASEALLSLKPVTFHYKSDKTGMSQFGLIAEEVAEVNPDLVVRDKDGDIYTVRYDAVNAMLLNEFLKEHKKVEAQQTTIAQLKFTVAQQQKGMAVLSTQLKEQAAQIQKVSAKLEMSQPAPRVVANTP